LLEYDDVMNYQRKGVYELRRRALAGENIQEMIDEAVNAVVEDVMDDYVAEGLHPEHWNIEGVRTNLERVFDVTFDATDDQMRDHSRNELRQILLERGRERVGAVRERMTDEVFHSFARMLLLQLTDDLWKDHLLALDRLRQGVGLRGYGQRNPLLEYKREALQMYLMMNAMRDETLLSNLVHAQDEVAQAASGARNPKAKARQLAASNFQLPEQAAPSLLDQLPLQQPVFQAPPRLPAKGEEAKRYAVQFGVRRNDPCPCGSGLKHKRCCYDVELPADELAALAPAVSLDPELPEEPEGAEPEAPDEPEVPDLLAGFDLTRLPEKGAEAKRLAIVLGARNNDPCPCGSGQKYKKCCRSIELPPGEEEELLARVEAARVAAEQAAEARQVVEDAAAVEAAQRIAAAMGDADVAVDDGPSLDAPTDEGAAPPPDVQV
ncbi:MAG: SEC-C domain-containing protein, partial [Myxococcales bacterium]|nr:SEC-C domain-containing protein [Myxococcales bacterium]